MTDPVVSIDGRENVNASAGRRPACDADLMHRTAYLAADGFVDDLAARARRGRCACMAGCWSRRGRRGRRRGRPNVWLDPQQIRGRLDLGCGGQAARDPAQLGGLCAGAASPRDADPAAAAQGVGQAAGVRRRRRRRRRSARGPCSTPDTVLAAPRCTSPFPNGEVALCRGPAGPPSRAYLKLWEALTLIGAGRGPGERCLDLGSSPGGWSWALQRMGAQRHQRRQGAARPADRPPARHRASAGERLRPRPARGRPGRLAVFATSSAIRRGCWRWSSAGSPPAPADILYARSSSRARPTTTIARRFAAIPGSELRHLFHNKHELTWSKIE